MLASFSSICFLHYEKDIGNTYFLSYLHIYIFPFWIICIFPPFPSPTHLYIARFTPFPFLAYFSSLLFNPFPSLLLSTHSFLSLIFLCLYIFPPLVPFPWCCIYSASPSSFNWFPSHLAVTWYSCSSAAARWPPPWLSGKHVLSGFL
jgi:hypothetical protein